MYAKFPEIKIPEDQTTDLEHCVDKAFNYFKVLIQSRPPELFHYTNAAGLNGIISSSTIWATHLAYLNDTSEYQHAVSVFQGRVTHRLSETPDNSPEREPLELLASRRFALEPSEFPAIFVSCFTALNNDLSQWRAYGAGEGRYSIEFDATALGVGGHKMRVTLAPVLYKKILRKPASSMSY